VASLPARPFGFLKPDGSSGLRFNKGPRSIVQNGLPVSELILNHDKFEGGLALLFGYIDLVGANTGLRLPLRGETIFG
jgi:hypothetical protein